MNSKFTKDMLIKETALQLDLPEELVHAIILFQGEDAAKAAHVHNEIEFSGLGKFLLSQTRIKKGIEKYTEMLTQELTEERRGQIEEHLKNIKTRER